MAMGLMTSFALILGIGKNQLLPFSILFSVADYKDTLNVQCLSHLCSYLHQQREGVNRRLPLPLLC